MTATIIARKNCGRWCLPAANVEGAVEAWVTRTLLLVGCNGYCEQQAARQPISWPRVVGVTNAAQQGCKKATTP